MIDVNEVFPGRPQKTRLYASAAVIKGIEQYQKRRERHRGQLVKKLYYWAQNGFELFEGDKSPIRHEWNGVYRIGQQIDLFRIIGFYEDGQKKSFIAIDAFMKTDQRLTESERHRIDAVAKVRKDGNWRKGEPDGEPQESADVVN